MVGGNAISPARTEAASRGKARKRGVRRTLCWLIAGALIGWPLPTLAQSLSQGPLQKRLQAILQLSAEQMAATSSFTKRAYDAQLAHVNRIQNKQLRDTVLEFVLKPAATAYGQSATQSWLASPGSGWKSHHSYPGGLSVHNLEWVEAALGWADTYEKVYGVKLDRDVLIAGLVLHDWGKVWFLFDDPTGKIGEPDWYPKAWGTKGKWKWMGGHGAVLYAELMHRGLPNDLLFAVAAAHFDPYWALEKDDEGLNPALREAAQIAKKAAPQMKPTERMAEWWVIQYVDDAWSFSTMVAARFAFETIESIVKELDLKPDSREANKVAWFVLSRVGDFKIYEAYQKGGYDQEAAKKLVRSVLEDPTPYEIAKR
jgi:hypothetical protein